jgi:dTDP-4-amino-4,6-dideoxygalactose transaminase
MGPLNDLLEPGRSPLFETPLHMGQLYLPPWDDFERMFRGIFERHYFTNSGPLLHEFEERFARRCGVRHAVAMTNGTTALMAAAVALELRGKVIVPAYTFIATVQALTWAGLEPVFCDVDPSTHCMTPATVEPLIDDDVCALLGVHIWGRACDVKGLTAVAARHDLRLFFDAAHAVSCTLDREPIGGFGDVEIFSLHATKVLSAMEGGVATTNDDLIATRLRTVRNVHVVGTHTDVSLRMNGKMSEAQAAMGLLSLEGLDECIAHNRTRHALYRELLAGLPGISCLAYDEAERNNYQYILVQVDETEAGLSRDDLICALESENVLARRYFKPGAHRLPPYRDDLPQFVDALPVTDHLCSTVMQLPSGQHITDAEIRAVGGLVRYCVNSSELVRQRLAARRGA